MLSTVAIVFHPTFASFFHCASILVNLVKYKEADLRIFRGVFTKKPGATHESFTFSGNHTVVVVSIDYTQSGALHSCMYVLFLAKHYEAFPSLGTSPEVAECNRKLVNLSTSQSATFSNSLLYQPLMNLSPDGTCETL